MISETTRSSDGSTPSAAAPPFDPASTRSASIFGRSRERSLIEDTASARAGGGIPDQPPSRTGASSNSSRAKPLPALGRHGSTTHSGLGSRSAVPYAHRTRGPRVRVARRGDLPESVRSPERRRRSIPRGFEEERNHGTARVHRQGRPPGHLGDHSDHHLRVQR